MFKDRRDAGEQLGRALEHLRDEKPLILGIPRGGAEVAYYVARYLGADLSIVVARKLPYPSDPEAGFGAVAEDGSTFMFDRVTRYLTEGQIDRIKEDQVLEAERRVNVLRGGKPLPEMKDRTVVLVDDGIAMGSTMRAAISLCRRRGVCRLVVAVPVSGPEVATEIGALADELVVLKKPPFFRAVAQVYEKWHDVSDGEVLKIIEK